MAPCTGKDPLSASYIGKRNVAENPLLRTPCLHHTVAENKWPHGKLANAGWHYLLTTHSTKN